MSDSEDESDVDFSASEDEFVPSDDDDSENSEENEESQDSDENEESGESNVEEVRANKTLQGSKRKPLAKNTKTKPNKRKNTQDDNGDSDSSVENYLVNPNEIDLASDFFTKHPNTALNIPPTFDCNIGVSLSDSDEEVFEEVPSNSKPMDFNAHENFNKQLENAKEHLKNYKSKKVVHDNNENDVNKLLAIGEASLATTSSSMHKKRNKDLKGSDESDWEEVEGESKVEKKNDVEIRIGPTLKQKPNKRQAEIEASIKRKINLRKKENQLAMHKVHLLGWIAYGNFVNKVLNSTKLMEMVVKFIPSEKCYPKSQTDVKYFEQIIKWYKTVVGLKSKEQNCSLTRLPPIASSLALQIQSKMAICKKDFVFIFVVLLRSMGIQCRLAINLVTVPIRPSAKDLCVISMKNSDDQKTATSKAADKSSKKKNGIKVGSKSKKGSSKTLVSTKSPSKADDKSNTKISKSQDVPSTSTKILEKSEGTSKSIKNLKPKLDEAVKAVEKNRTTDFTKKKTKRRSLSLNTDSSVAVKPKRARVSTLNDDQSDGPIFSKSTSNNVSIFNSPISGHTRSRQAKDNPSNATAIAKRKIPQLDGADDKKAKKQKPKLFKLKLPFRSASVSRSPSPSAATISPTKSTATAQPTKKTNTKGELVPKSASTSAQNESKRNKEKPQLYKLRLPLTRSRSVTKSPTQSTSKSISRRSKSSSTVKATTKTTSLTKSAPTSTTKITSKPSSSTSTTRSATITKKLDSKTEATTSSASTSTSTIRSETITKKLGSKTEATTSSASTATSKTKEAIKKVDNKRKSHDSVSSDSDFAPTPKKFSSSIKKPLPKPVEKLKKRIDRRVLSTDDESVEASVKKSDMNYWIEVFCEAEEKWMCIDLFKLTVNSIDDVKKNATKPIAYVLAWNNNNTIKDVSSRYCPNWNTTTRKLRVDIEWMNEALLHYKEPNTPRSKAEDNELNKIHLKEPLPKSISEYKNHPLYALKRHLLKFEGIYPPDAITCGFIRDEGVYLRGCVHTLHSREIWVKQARVVKPSESPYKIVKARPKWDRLANKMLEPQPLEIFGKWQTQPYVPPTAENGIVPRNAYGNVELFKPEMLPKKTVHLRLAGLNRVCSKLKIDCAQAVVGFDFHGGSSHPTFDGFVVCEEFAELVTAQWVEEQEEIERKSEQKRTQRVYDNWKKLIKGLLIRERLQRKYNFAGKDASSSKK